LRKETTMTVKGQKDESLLLPEIVVCSSTPYKKEVMKEMGLPEDYWLVSSLSDEDYVRPNSVEEVESWWRK